MSTTATTPATHPTWTALTDRVIEASRLGSCAAVLYWDQQTKMPPEGIEPRGRQLALLARMTHELATSDEVGDLLSECVVRLEAFQQSCCRHTPYRELGDPV
jgi:Zn-dependent M32 family carboxypeptidase